LVVSDFFATFATSKVKGMTTHKFNPLKIRYMKQNITDNYIKAFISVAQLLEPQVEFDEVKENWHKAEGFVKREVCVSGRLGNELIIVSEEQHKGLQIVSTHYDRYNMKILSKRSVWYFAFNWKGIMNSGGDL